MKLWNYIFTMTGMGILLALAGLEVAGISILLEKIGLTLSSNGIETFAVESTLWNKIFGTEGLLIAIGATGLVGIGTFLYTKDKSFLIIPLITGVLVYWGSIMVSIVQQKGSYTIFGVIVGIIGIVMTIGFIQSCVDYFLGVD